MKTIILKSEFELGFGPGSTKANHSGEIKIVGGDVFIYMRDGSTSISGWVKDEDIEDLAIAILVERGYVAFMTTLSSCKSSKQSKMDYPKHQ